MRQEFWIDSAQRLVLGIIDFIPTLLGIILLIIVGWLIAVVLARLIERAIDFLGIDKLLRKAKVDTYFERVGLKLHSGRFLGQIVYWIIILVLIFVVSDTLGLFALSEFLHSAISYIPNLVAAVFILIIAAVIADFVKKAAKTSAMSANIVSAKLLGTLGWWAVMIFGLITALKQLGVDTALIDIAIQGIIIGGALAFGLAFGLGGKNYAEQILERLKSQSRGSDHDQ